MDQTKCATYLKLLFCEIFSLLLVLAICVVWILGWTGCLGTLSEQLKTIQSYSGVINSVYGVINTIIVVILGLKSKRKISKQMAREQELGGLMRQDVTTIVDGMENSRCENQERLSLLQNEVSATYNTVDLLRTEQQRRNDRLQGCVENIRKDAVDAQSETFKNLKTIIEQNKELLENNKRMLEVLDSPSAPVRVTSVGNKSSNKLSKHVIKITLVGASFSGKSCLLQCWFSNEFNEHFPSTIGAAFFLRKIETNVGAAQLNVWDTAGNERYDSLSTMYVRQSTCVVILIDVTNESSLPVALRWFERCKKQFPECFVVFICNKIDLT